ncbi:MAG: S41 family peptidase [Stellaceae bacterium]
MPLMPRAGFARMVLLLWSALLVGCAHSPAPPRGNATARLYTRALQEIGLVYIAPVSDQKLMLAGLAGLSRLDRKLSIAETPAPAQQIGIALTYGGRQLALYALPREGDEAGWGLLASRAIAAAKAASPTLAAASETRIDAVVLDGMTGALDRFSRYSTPGAARVQRVALDGLGVKPTLRQAEQDGIAVLRITAFNRDTAVRLAAALQHWEREPGLRGIVLDLRGDPGGLLKQAVGVAQLFIANGPIVATVGRNPASRQFFRASGTAIAPAVPLVVLIDGGSASASEIVAAALQDAHRAVVIGSASYGKGSVQTVLPLPNGGVLIVTWALLLRPSGALLARHGVIPNLCTSGLADAGPVLARVLSGGWVAPPSPTAGRSEGDWQRLRRACPPRPGDRRVDLAVARRLFADPFLYRAVLDGRRPNAAPPVPSSTAILTEPRSRLISIPLTP